ncbi:hypothetical protein HXZ62_08000 [Empedobacter falsenii]|uniref:hypothetical protein n=1 Tax=Empedobacter falsenii TaxID=343874 RepID=UPI0025781851|nr:hypothetical protein [Empedobacter falsenii]MDM1062503.1 hypothetical protein [Empedobacter falsenii]
MKINIYLTLSIFLTIISCQKKDKISANLDSPQRIITTQIKDTIKSLNIFYSNKNNNILRVFVPNKNQTNSYFYSDTAIVLKIESISSSNKRKLVDLLHLDWTYLTIDSANINVKTFQNKPFLFFSAKTDYMGRAVNIKSVYFWMINTKNIKENYKLTYTGYLSPICDECIKGDFEKNNLPKEIENSLLDFVKTSSLIFQKTNKKEDTYKDYEDKWQMDNNLDGHFGAGNLEPLHKIYSTYYKENLFKIGGSSSTKIENDDYIINSYFRGNLIGYDKNKKVYFPILVESCSYSCDKKIEFVNSNTIKIEYEDSIEYEIDLSKIIFK